MNSEGLHVVHAVAGRVRFKLSKIKGNPQQAEEVQARLSVIPGVHRVHANPLTGSVVAVYEPSALRSVEFQLAVASALGIALADIEPDLLAAVDPALHNGFSPPQEPVVSFQQMQTLVPLLLTILGVRSLLFAERIAYPSWYDYFWFAFGSYSMLNRDPSPKI